MDFFTSQIAHDWHAGVLLLHIYIVYMYVPTKTKTHNSTFSSLKNQLHERDRKNVLCNIGTVHFKARQNQLAKMNTYTHQCNSVQNRSRTDGHY